MKNYSLQQRAAFYNQKFPKFPPLHVSPDGRWLYGVWCMGQNYRVKSKFYGGYPHGYLDRITTLFPDAKHPLHLFSGALPPDPTYRRCDLKPERFGPDGPSVEYRDICGNAEQLAGLIPGLPGTAFDIIYADPPYSKSDAKHYGTPMVNRNKVVKECAKVLQPGGFLVWLDQVLPMFRKAEWQMCGTIGMVKSTNHRFRVVTIFQRK